MEKTNATQAKISNTFCEAYSCDVSIYNREDINMSTVSDIYASLVDDCPLLNMHASILQVAEE